MKLFLASGNAHKVAEFQALATATQLPVEIISAREAGGMPPVVEDAGSFVGNARKKALALHAQLASEAWVLADDSGLCVDALGGAPGVESAYFAGPQHDSAANLKKIVEVMREVPEGRRGASFYCLLVLLEPGGAEQVFEGSCTGVLGRESKGGQGFGYDPIFVPSGFDRTYAQLSETEKNKISHRSLAFAQLARWLRENKTRRS